MPCLTERQVIGERGRSSQRLELFELLEEVSVAGNLAALKEIYQKIRFSVAAISLWFVK